MNKITQRTEVESAVKNVVINRTRLDAYEYDANASFLTLGIDSIDALEMGMEIGDQLGVELADELLIESTTPQILVNIICNILKLHKNIPVDRNAIMTKEILSINCVYLSKDLYRCQMITKSCGSAVKCILLKGDPRITSCALQWSTL
jgi:acyl carrier protein